MFALSVTFSDFDFKSLLGVFVFYYYFLQARVLSFYVVLVVRVKWDHIYKVLFEICAYFCAQIKWNLFHKALGCLG